MSSLPLKVLLIEDDEDDQRLVCDLLADIPSTRYEVDWAATYEEALGFVERGRYDVYLLDYRLGRHNGLEFLHEMGCRGCEIPIILLTGQGSFEVDMEAMRSGAADYLIKAEINAPLLERSIRYAIERRRSEERLRKSEEKMRLIIENSPVGIRICQRSKYVYVNPAFLGLFGYEEPEEIMGLPEEMLFAPEEREWARRIERGRMEDGYMPLSYEAKGLRKNGERFDLTVRATRIEYRGESAILDFILDVSSEKALQARLLRAQKMQALGTLAGGIAHDFNNILAIVLGFTELAFVEVDPNSRARQNLEHAIETVHRGIDLVNRILTFSRQDGQEFRPLHLGSITKEALKLMRASLPSTIEIRQELALAEGEDLVLSDPVQIHQILMNLCTNAAHAMRKTGGILGVRLSLVRFELQDVGRPPELRPGEYVKMTVSDTGYGIDPAIVHRIFDPYFTTKELGEGTGLGLGVVHGIVRSHEGAVSVYSEKGKGTVFNIYLPRCEEEAKPEAVLFGILPTGTERILLVDDEDRLVDAGAQILERLGYRVVQKTSGLEALEAFRAEPDAFDLIITDQTMPHKTGIELAKEVLCIRPDLPIILCTGFSEIATAEKARSLGIREYVVKPFLSRDMALTVRRVLDESRKGGES